MPIPRSLTALLGAALLLLTLAGCADEPVGTITGINGTVSETLSSPFHDACHNFSPLGVDSVINRTLTDVVLHHGPDCDNPQGAATYYLATDSSVGGGAAKWRSFSIVGWRDPAEID
ncbi:hypothetical protein GCM10010193_27580 [Kitasatospora atroaurantiaca]|uniref:Lipoprotein n=1 Tax=Kitasatospora atroaurantiaca TaxID=285545 RepID=A0A561EJY8_9ACTN|nr:hypothetical protein [Kitasatospora atroaurantiaca]TWE15924.1 hypothetical protein FB465_0876 [Kitasatospora atroaurantiaca]